MRSIYIIRHGQTEYNRQGILQGRAIDAPLNNTGALQAESFYEAYNKIGFKKIITSDLQRSIQSVDQFLGLGIEHMIDERITEFSWGENEGLPLNEIVIDNYREMLNSWKIGDLDAKIPGGESGRELRDRVHDFIKEIKELEDHPILICTHGRTLKMLVVEMLKKDLEYMEEIRHSNMALYLFRQQSDSFQLIKENDVSHLAPSLQENVYWDK